MMTFPTTFDESHVEAYYHVRYLRNYTRDYWESTSGAIRFELKRELDAMDEWLSRFEAWMTENQIPNEYELKLPYIKSTILSVTVGS